MCLLVFRDTLHLSTSISLLTLHILLLSYLISTSFSFPLSKRFSSSSTMSTPHTRSKSKPAKTPNPSSSSLKRQKTISETSTQMSPEKSSQPSSSKILSKPILKERICDLVLLQQVGVIDLFSALGCESLLSPPDIIYPSLVREFYSNFSMMKEDMVYSEVQGVPIVFNANLLSRVCGISCSGVCPYTTHAAFMEFPGL